MKYCYPNSFKVETFKETQHPAIDSIKNIHQLGYLVAQELKLSLNMIRSPSRKFEYSQARFIIMHFAYYKLEMTLKTIGEYLNRDHSTITWGMSQLNDLMDTNRLFKQKYMTVKGKIV